MSRDATEASGRIDGLAYRHVAGRQPTILFLPGYMSDMTGDKATAIAAHAAGKGRAVLRLDYSGCGASAGAFEEGTLTRWRDDVLAVVAARTEGPLLLVGSSMGGWLMLLVALAIPDRIAGLVGVAAAPDFTDWGFSDAKKARLRAEGRIEERSDYGERPYVTTRGFFESGQANLLLGGEIPLDCPVRLLHGQRDADVPFEIPLRLAARLRSADVQTVLVKDGDHRLSRGSDIALLLATIDRLLEGP